MKRIYWIRHGQTETNASQRFDGEYDSALTEVGREQVARLARRLADVPLSRVIASDLRRALQTAKAVAAPHHLPVEQHRGLRERRFGAWEGLTAAEVRSRWPQGFQAWVEDYAGGRPEGGETFAEMAARVVRAIEEILASSTGSEIAVVAHGGTVRAALCHALDLPPAGARHFKTDNAGLTIIEYGHRYGARVLVVNDTSHGAGARVKGMRAMRAAILGTCGLIALLVAAGPSTAGRAAATPHTRLQLGIDGALALHWSAELSWQRGPWTVRAGNRPARTGVSPYAGLLLSETAAPYPNLEITYRPERWPGFAYGQLIGWVDVAFDRYLLAHHLTYRQGRGLFWLGEAAVVSGRFAAQPLNQIPGWPYYATQHLLLRQGSISNDEANVNYAAGAAWELSPGGRLYGELLVDDYPWGPADRVVPRVAWLAGWQRGLAGIEHVHLANYVYSHKGGSSFAHGGAPLGHPLGPDADQWRIRLPGPKWDTVQTYLEGVLEHRGEGRLGEDWVGRYSYAEAMRRHFLSGVVEERQIIRTGGIVRAGQWEGRFELGLGRIENAGHVVGRRSGLFEWALRLTWRS